MLRLRSSILLFLLTVSSVAFAESEIFKNDKFNIRLGTFFIGNTETELRYDSGTIIGATLNTQRDLGMNDSLQTFRADGYYRFNERHSIDYAWYHIGRDGSVALDHDIDWGDIEYLQGQLDSDYKTNIYKISYGWSFHHDEKVELALLAGLHITDIDISLRGLVDTGGGATAVDSTSTSVTAPLPVVGFKLNYNITPRWIWRTKYELFHMNFGNYDGTFSDLASTIEYRPFDRAGFGFGFNTNLLNIEAEDNNKTLTVTDHVGGWLAFMSLYF